MKVIEVNQKSVQYSEIPPNNGGWYRAFEISVDGQPYIMSVNKRGEPAETDDHPIVSDHPDVVKEILKQELLTK